MKGTYLLTVIDASYQFYCFRIIEQCFRDFLRIHVENSNLEVPLKYTSAILIGPNVKEEIFHPISLPKSNTEELITLKISTPLFYSLIALDSNPATFISSSVQPSSPHSLTFHTSHPAILASFFSPSQIPVLPSLESSVSANPSADPSPWRWSLLARLRRHPHPLDQHSAHLPPVLKRQYRMTILKLVLSDSLFFSLPLIVDISSTAVKITLCYLSASTLLAACRTYGSVDGMGTEAASVSWMDVLGLMGIHIWQLSSTMLGFVL